MNSPSHRRACRLICLRLFIALFVVAALTQGAFAHSLFLKLYTYILEPETPTSIALINGTFHKSDNVIDRDRMVDVSVVGPEEGVVHPELSKWRDEGTTTWLDFRTGQPGTYVMSVSTKARTLEMEAEKFNKYLRNEGVPDTYAERERNGELELPARESYAKHVKAVIQVGEARSGAFDAVLGYPVEIVPLENPYDLAPGDTLPVRVLKEGKPLANQPIFASHADFHDHAEDGSHLEAFSGRTDAAGEVRIPIDKATLWYVRLIHMMPAEEEDLDYKSEWATLTFEIAPAKRGSLPLLPLAGIGVLLVGCLMMFAWLVQRRDGG